MTITNITWTTIKNPNMMTRWIHMRIHRMENTIWKIKRNMEKTTNINIIKKMETIRTITR